MPKTKSRHKGRTAARTQGTKRSEASSRRKVLYRIRGVIKRMKPSAKPYVIATLSGSPLKSPPGLTFTQQGRKRLRVKLNREFEPEGVKVAMSDLKADTTVGAVRDTVWTKMPKRLRKEDR